MTSSEPVFQYSRFGFSLAVFANRIEVQEGTLMKKRRSILLRNVTEVERTRSGKLKVTTNDGKSHEFVVGTHGDEAREAILGLL